MEGVHIYDGETNFDEDRKLKLRYDKKISLLLVTFKLIEETKPIDLSGSGFQVC